jgi:chromosomal replication initiator protein
VPAQSSTRRTRSKQDNTTAPPRDHARRQITERLTNHLGPHKFNMWFGRAELVVDGDSLEVATDSQFVARWIDSHYADDLKSAAEEALGKDATYRVSVRSEPDTPPSDDSNESTRRRAGDRADNAWKGKGKRRRKGDGSGGRQLDDFVVGDSNRLAHSAASQLVHDPSASMISPLFVHGECGVGKTHVLQGICHAVKQQPGQHSVRCLTGEQFTNEYITAIRGGTLDEFRRRLRQLDVLAVDDIHFLSNKVRTQSEFLHTLDALDLTGARVVLTSDAHPRMIKRFSQALISRFLSGTVVQIDRPDRETRIALIRRLAATRSLPVTDAAVESVATRCVGSVRELEGAVTKLAALHSLASPGERNEVGLVLVQRLFNERTWQPAAPVRIAQVIDAVCDRLRIARSDLMGTGRHRKVVLARALVAHLGRELTTHSYPEIAQAVFLAYHATVHTAAARLRRQMGDDESVSLNGGDIPVRLRDLVDQVRHDIVRAAQS